jgi:hypothetical protein
MTGEGNTIIGASFEERSPLRSMLLEQSDQAQPENAALERAFKIRAADSHGRRSATCILVNRMYETRGYRTGPSEEPQPNVLTLMATEHDATIGTISVRLDSPDGLLAEQLFSDEVRSLREAGRRVCEFTKLAIDNAVKSKRVLASLFHVAYMFAHRVRGCHDVLIEVNPRHVNYYRRMLGFEVIGPERLNQRVMAPAVLLRLDFAHAHAQIDQFGGRQRLAKEERSLYPYCFSVPVEAGIVARQNWSDVALPLRTPDLETAR